MNIHSYRAGWPDSDRERERTSIHLPEFFEHVNILTSCWFTLILYCLTWTTCWIFLLTMPQKIYIVLWTFFIISYNYQSLVSITSHCFMLLLSYYIQSVSLTPSKPTSFKSDFEFIGLACIKHQFRIHVVRLFARRTHSSGFATLRARRDQRADDGVHFLNHCLRRITINIY